MTEKVHVRFGLAFVQLINVVGSLFSLVFPSRTRGMILVFERTAMNV